MLLRKGALKSCSKFPGEHPCRSTISIKLQSKKSFSVKLQSNFIETALRHGCSPVNLMHIFRIPFLKNTSEWLLLKLWTFYPGSSQLQFWYISNIDTTIPFPRAFLHPSPSLSNFPLVNLNPSSTQSSLCSSSVSLFFSYPIRPRQKYWIYQTISRAKLYKSWYVMGQNATY